MKRSNLPRRSWAMVLALGAHLLALLALGWRIPKVPPSLTPESLPPVQIQLLRPPLRSAPPATPAAPGVRARPSPRRPSAAVPSIPFAPVPAPPAPQAAAGPPDCEPEDLPLLTDAAKARCRNQIDADQARRLARAARGDAARQVAEAQRGPQTRRMSSDKESYYGAVADAYWQQSHGPPNAGHSPSLSCGGKAKRGLRIGPCTVIPPQGFLTEEAGVPPR